MFKELVKIEKLDYSWVYPPSQMYIVSAIFSELERINKFILEEAVNGRFSMFIGLQNIKTMGYVIKILSNLGYSAEQCAKPDNNQIYISWVNNKIKGE